MFISFGGVPDERGRFDFFIPLEEFYTAWRALFSGLRRQRQE